MFKKLTNILTANCEVIKLDDDRYVYPIFKNGLSSLFQYAEIKNLAVFKNEKISMLKKITVFLRTPKARFASGVHTFFYLTNTKINENILKKIENFEIVNRHFIPQYLWLFHLYKYFNGEIEFRSVEELLKLIPNRDGPWTKNTHPWRPMTANEKNKILSIDYKKYTEVDEKLIKKYMNRSIKLEQIIKEFKI